eukprot:7291296-Lingulodinium_polyedra.AAC.1
MGDGRGVAVLQQQVQGLVHNLCHQAPGEQASTRASQAQVEAAFPRRGGAGADAGQDDEEEFLGAVGAGGVLRRRR